MELVYLWVEKYKNIHKRGFNFSPQFECDFDDKSLTIKEHNNIPNFFGKNINIMAIVGKNGSGKSSVLECLKMGIDSFLLNDDIQFGADYPNFKKYLLVYRENNEYFNLGNIHIKYKNLINRKDNYDYIKNFVNKNSLYQYQKNQNLLELILQTFYSLNSKHIIFFKPNKIILDFFNGGSDFDIDIVNLSLKDKLINIINSKFQAIQDNLHTIRENISIEEYIELLIKKRTRDLITYEKEIDNLENLLSIEKFINDNFDTIIYTSRDNLFYTIDTPINQKVKFFLLALNKLNILKIYDSKYSETDNETYKNFGINFHSLSSGEKSFLNILLDILYQLQTTNKNITFLIDEPDNSFHPYWQKNFIFELMKTLKSFEVNIKIIITSHSPFLLSDIPKRNIIFLDKEENGNCKVLFHDEVLSKKQTFGANIHTLLSDSFFMEDGLMGEFAKNKIRTIKVAHRYVLHKHKRETLFTQSSKRCRRLLIKRLPKFWQIQKIIGEPFLQKIVKNQLEEIELILLGRYEAIDKEIARLEALKVSMK